ncbi:hypothetical protein GH5_08129 [Leishmania sp. Ghana 2012 LV757]|uniref:hypothetical protein n=1 Tax=Leishmania sp. Ghana 2012 LV757 TaxID=2803181 RepID=UPI001B7231EA|nr:hypothetical protein GH5_08129 [Leishmania sp. Ghana 2012 LV757]
MPTAASSATAVAAATGLGACVDPLPPPQGPLERADQRRLVRADSGSAATAAAEAIGASVSASAAGSLGDVAQHYQRGNDAATSPLASGLPLKAARRPTSRASAGGRKSLSLAGTTCRPQEHAAVTQRLQVHHPGSSLHRLSVRESFLQEGGGPASVDARRSRNSSVTIAESTFGSLTDSAPRTAGTAAKHLCRPSKYPPRRPPLQAKQPHPKHGQLPLSCQSIAIQPSRKASGLFGGGGSHVSFGSWRVSASAGSVTAAASGLKDTTPVIFPTSRWIRATLDVAATPPHHHAETPAKSLRTPQLARLTTRPNVSAAQAAAQLHERRVAAATESREEMREFAAILRRVEATGGANALRQLQQRRKRDAGGASPAGREGGRACRDGQQRPHQRRCRETGALPGEHASHRSSSPLGSSSSASDRLKKPSMSDGGGSGGEEAGEYGASVSDVFSEMTELDDDGFVATMSSHLPTRNAAGSLPSRRVRGRRRKAGGAAAELARKASAAVDAEAAAAEIMLRVTLSKLRDRTARGLVALQHRRAAHARAGKPVLEREVQESQQRLVRAYTATSGEGGGAGAPERATSCETLVATAASEQGPVYVVGPSDETPVPSTILVVGDLTALNVSWGGIPDGAQAGGDGAAGGDDSNEIDFSSATPSAASARDSARLPKVDSKADSRKEERDSSSCAGSCARSGGRREDRGRGGAGPLSANVDTPAESIAGPDRCTSLPTPLCSVLSNSPSPTADAHTPPPAASHLLGSDKVSLGQAAHISADVSEAAIAAEAAAAAEGEHFLRSELQRLLAEADKCSIYGLHRALRGRGGSGPYKPVRGAGAVAQSGRAGDGTDGARHSASIMKADRCRLGERATSPTLQAPVQSSGRKDTTVTVPLVKTACSAPLAVPLSAAAAGAPGRRAKEPSSLLGRGDSSKLLKRHRGAHLTSDRANSASVLSATAAASLSTSLPVVKGSTTATVRSRAVMAPATFPVVSAPGVQAPAADVAAAAGVSPRPRCHGCHSEFRKRKELPRHKPLPAVVGVSEHAVGILQHELLLTRRWELEADQARGRDIECTCAMLQRLRPLREQLMEWDISAGTGRASGATHRATESGKPLLLMLGPVPGSRMAPPPDAALEAPMPLPSVLSNAPASSTAEAAIARSNVPHAALHRQRQLIYDEAVRLDTACRLEARTAYLDVLTRLAHKHVSSVSWPAVSALLGELRERLQREVQLAIGAPATQTTVVASSSSKLAVTPKMATTTRRSSFSATSLVSRASAALPATASAPPPPSPSAQQYGGLQGLIATHLSVLELTQWAVQEVLQHLAALYHVPLSILHEWIAERQRHYSRSYNYEERFLAVDRTLAGRAVTTDKVLRITLHRCRRPPLAPPQSPSAIVAGEAMDCVNGIHQQPQPSGQGEDLYYIQVRSAVQSVASTAVPLSSTAATPFSGVAAPTHGFPGTLSEDAAVSTVRSLSEIASNSAMPPSSSSAKALNFLGQSLIVSLITSAATVPSCSKDHQGRTATRGAPRYRNDDNSDGDADAKMNGFVLAVGLMQAGIRSPLACGELDLRKYGFNAYGTNNGVSRWRAQNVQIMLRRKGYRSAELRVTLEIL